MRITEHLTLVGQSIVIRIEQARIGSNLLFRDVIQAVAIGILEVVVDPIPIGIEMKRTGSGPGFVQIIQPVGIRIGEGIIDIVGRFKPIGHSVLIQIARHGGENHLIETGAIESGGMPPIDQHIVQVAHILHRLPAVIGPEIRQQSAALPERGGGIQPSTRARKIGQRRCFADRAENQLLDLGGTQAGIHGQNQRGHTGHMRAGH